MKRVRGKARPSQRPTLCDSASTASRTSPFGLPFKGRATSHPHIQLQTSADREGSAPAINKRRSMSMDSGRFATTRHQLVHPTTRPYSEHSLSLAYCPRATTKYPACSGCIHRQWALALGSEVHQRIRGVSPARPTLSYVLRPPATPMLMDRWALTTCCSSRRTTAPPLTRIGVSATSTLTVRSSSMICSY